MSIAQFVLRRSARIAESDGNTVSVVHGGASWPAGMVSPNAGEGVGRVFRASPGLTVTPSEHVAVCAAASRAAQVTVDGPMGNSEPLGGTQDVVTFPTPPLTVGGGNRTATGWPSPETAVCDVAHAIVRRDEG